jgi:putative membrane protein
VAAVERYRARAMLRQAFLSTVFNIAAIFVASIFIDGIDYGSKFWVLILAGIVFGLVNLLVKPIVSLLALPVIVITLGIALFFVNLFMLYLTSWIVGPFDINSFGDAIWGTLIIWVVNAILHSVFGLEARKERKAKR